MYHRYHFKYVMFTSTPILSGKWNAKYFYTVLNRENRQNFFISSERCSK